MGYYKKMVGAVNGGRIPRQVFSVVNGGHDPGTWAGSVSSRAGSDCGGIEFRREDVEALLNEKIRPKDKFSLKVSSFLLLDFMLCYLT